MKYLAYNAESLHIIAHCETLAGAKRSATRAMKRCRMSENVYIQNISVVAGTVEEYNAADIEVDTYSMLDPNRTPIKIKKSKKGGCCDPATERYHCM